MDLPNPGIEPGCPALQADSLHWTIREAHYPQDHLQTAPWADISPGCWDTFLVPSTIQKRIWERGKDHCSKHQVSLRGDICLSLLWGHHPYPITKRTYRWCRQPFKTIFYCSQIHAMNKLYDAVLSRMHSFLNLIQDFSSCIVSFWPYNHGQATNVLCTSISSSLKWVMVLVIALLWRLNKTCVKQLAHCLA